MPQSLLGILVVLFTIAPVPASAQAGGTAPAAATDVTSAQVQAALARASQELLSGRSASDHIISLPDMGKYNVGVALVTRPAGTFQGYLSHDEITEIYYVLKGSGVQATGTLIGGTRGATESKRIGPSLSGKGPLQNGRSTRLGPGDIQVIPQGVGHGFTSIEPGGIEYLIFRIDPDHVLALE